MIINKNYEFANFGVRLGALIIDSIIVFILYILFIRRAITTIRNNLSQFIDEYLIVLIASYFIILPLVTIFYRSFFESSNFKGTPGKIIVGIKVVDHNFDKISFQQAFYRNLTKLFLSSICYIGYIVALGNDKVLTWHDKLAKTYVIREIKYIVTKPS